MPPSSRFGRTRMISEMILFWIGLSIFVFFNGISAKRVTLLDSTKESELKWSTYTVSQESEDGWTEESYASNKDGQNWRSYIVCDIRKDFVNNWLRTPYIERGDAQRLSVEVSFSMRDCKKFPYTARTCKETFTLLAYEADIDFANRDQPPWTDIGLDSYRRIDRLTASEGRFTDKDNLVTNTETRYMPVSRKGVYFAFRDEGACISLLSVKVYYEVCEEKLVNFAIFPETVVGPNLTSIKEVNGRCADNASLPSASASLKYYCKGDGSWDLLNGGCQCDPGYRPDGMRCVPCEIGFYKDTPGTAGCVACPARSSTRILGSTYCQCDPGYYRSPLDPKSAPCHGPATPPQGLHVISTDQSRAIIGWNRPDSARTMYRIDCPMCPSDTSYIPRKNRLNSTVVTLANLEPGTTYLVNVFTEGDTVAQADGRQMFATINLTTQSATTNTKIDAIRIDTISATELTFSWNLPTPKLDPAPVTVLPGRWWALLGKGLSEEQPPLGLVHGTTPDPNHRQNTIRYYMVRLLTMNKETGAHVVVSPSLDYGDAVKIINESIVVYSPTFTFWKLIPDTEYGFQVRADTNFGLSLWSDIVWTKTNFSQGASTDFVITMHSPGIIAGVVIAAGVAIAVIIMITYCVWRRKIRPACMGGKQSDLDKLECKKDALTIVHCPQQSQLLQGRHGNASMPGWVMPPFHPPSHRSFGSATSRQYIDPLTYEDPNRRLTEFTNEIDPKDIIIEKVIGEGEFGKVCKGQLRIWIGRVTAKETVAIKTLKLGSSERSKSDFLMEASIMCQFDHENVIKLKGIVSRKEPVMIITEFVEHGSLDRFLRANKSKMEIRQLISMLRGIACGMTYLSEMGFVHRDLAARNILVDARLSCKIADFGLSRGLIDGSDEQIYMTRGGKIPVRWTAPEALMYSKYTSTSDVWSFGVVIWEVMSFGQRPYGHWTNKDVMEAVENGYRLDMPEACPPPVYQLMQDCWQQERQLRPLFSIILQRLDRFLQCPELLAAASTSSSPISHNSGSVTSLHSSSAAMRPSASGINNHPSTGSSSGFVSITAGNASRSSPLSTNPTSLLSPDYALSQVGIADFLHDLNLDQFISTFQAKNRHNVYDLTRLTIVDFASMGIPVMDQKRIREAIDKLRRQNYLSMGVTLPRQARVGMGPPPPLMANGSLSRRQASRNAKDGYYV